MKIELREIHKRFGAVHANAGINFSVGTGTILGILGENGAGKSTLMKILSGYFHPDSGGILLDGAAVRLRTPADALRHGVGMLHQDPLDFPPMRVLDNFLLGREHQFWQRRSAARADFDALCSEFEFRLDPEGFMFDLTVGERQQLEIARLLWLGARVLILDEPTTGISANQKVKLFATLRKLAAQNKTVIFVSHKLEDVEGLCGRVAVLRRGALVGEAQPPYTTAGLVQMMFGQALAVGVRPAAPLGAPQLELRGAEFAGEHIVLRNVDLTVAAGEVVGLAGLEGSGQQQLLKGVAGLVALGKGSLKIGGRDLSQASYKEFLAAGTAFMAADRLEEGMIAGLTIEEHMVLARRGKQPAIVDWAVARTAAQAGIAEFNIKGAPASVVEGLSGGNQQRALLALLPPALKLLAMEHPTRGLDVESAIYIWSKLLKRRAEGTAILFATADLEELLRYSDRVLVFFAGEIMAVLRAADATVEQLGALIGGKQK